MKDFIAQLDGYNNLKGNDKEVIKGMFKVYDCVNGFTYPKVDGFPSADDKHKSKVVNEAKADLKNYIVAIANDYIASKTVVETED